MPACQRLNVVLVVGAVLHAAGRLPYVADGCDLTAEEVGRAVALLHGLTPQWPAQMGDSTWLHDSNTAHKVRRWFEHACQWGVLEPGHVPHDDTARCRFTATELDAVIRALNRGKYHSVAQACEHCKEAAELLREKQCAPRTLWRAMARYSHTFGKHGVVEVRMPFSDEQRLERLTYIQDLQDALERQPGLLNLFIWMDQKSFWLSSSHESFEFWCDPDIGDSEPVRIVLESEHLANQCKD